ncbi:adenosylcobinamide amidohydrolase [Salsuginibacillus kocurii]|uniref:adenosylcobinamide amidohydrolase n=1 Tax=Salsuginibacillus kocurii TaxID=427078 RepID=UPI00036DD647|nr:adenosylcobinamide amidohydrolase [Salsuginibacillus kocurii]
MIEVKGLVGGYAGNPVIQGLDFSIQRGEFFALIGPNGSGKTTLFQLLTGRLEPDSGTIYIDGKPVEKMSKIEKAQKVAVLSQEVQVSFDYTVEEIVRLGRYPHQKGLLKTLSKEDRRVIEHVLEVTDTKQFRNTRFRLISGGEKQRVLLAKALAQEPEILLLDEPTNHLDIKHSFELLDLLKTWQATRDVTVFAILHDLNIASLYADRVALLHQGTFADVGDVNTLRKEKQLQRVYEVDVRTQPHPVVARPQLLMTPKESRTTGKRDFQSLYTVQQRENHVHIAFDQPLRAVSNGVAGSGIDWLKHFCNFHVDKQYDSSDPLHDVRTWMEDLSIPSEQAAGMMTAVYIKDSAWVERHIHGVPLLVCITAGVGNAVDITAEKKTVESQEVGTINIMVFMDAHLTDGAFINGVMSVTEAKAKALQDLDICDEESGSLATGTSTDSVLLAATQTGTQTPYAGSGTRIGKAIGEGVYEAMVQALERTLARDDSF